MAAGSGTAPDLSPTIVADTLLQHSRFFDHLVDLIPAKHYYDSELEPLNTKFMKQTARAVAKAGFKEQYKKNKRQKLDPDQAVTALDVQRKQLADANRAAGSQAEDDAPSTSGRDGARSSAARGTSQQKQRQQQGTAVQLHLQDGSTSRQELLDRLHAKIEAARKRKLDQTNTAQQAKEWRDKALQDNVKRKLQESGEGAHASGSTGKQHRKQQQQPQQHDGGTAQAGKQGKHAASGSAAAEEGFTFGKIELDDGKRRDKHLFKKKPTTEQLLADAEAKRAALKEAGETAEGKESVQQDAWRAAMRRAKGEKVLDDPKLLRRSLAKAGKKREKSAAAWKERKGKQTELQNAKQDKRKSNMDSRAQGKQDKKIAKREKKLLRAGFEGRKSGFIGGGSSKGGASKAAAGSTAPKA